MSSLPLVGCIAIGHPGQVLQSRTRALLNFPEGTLFYRASRDPDDVPAKPGNQKAKNFIIVFWIPDIRLRRIPE